MGSMGIQYDLMGYDYDMIQLTNIVLTLNPNFGAERPALSCLIRFYPVLQQFL
jgi:hypothetical protein